ncbi:hypothetical protein ABW19_dt0202736 [Dactylella cylindrospora]|nr:hypothetical protein ABW19_dt0202736 [Dactylella cylindrospora]
MDRKKSKRTSLLAHFTKRGRSKSPGPLQNTEVKPTPHQKPEISTAPAQLTVASLSTAVPTVAIDNSTITSTTIPRSGATSLVVAQNPTPGLWDKALSKLPQEEQTQLQQAFHRKIDIVQSVISSAEDARDLARDRAWKVQWKGEPIVIRDVMDKIITWVDKFKTIGDLAVQYNPGAASLPWVGVRFFLQIIVQDFENRAALLIGIEKVAKVIGRCTAYEGMYLQATVLSDEQRRLEEDLIRLYSRILTFLIKARAYFVNDNNQRITESILQNDFHDKYLKEIDEVEEDVIKAANIVDNQFTQNTTAEQRAAIEDLRDLVKSLESPIIHLHQQIGAIRDDIEGMLARLYRFQQSDFV